jgi:hypothetical protein
MTWLNCLIILMTPIAHRSQGGIGSARLHFVSKVRTGLSPVIQAAHQVLISEISPGLSLNINALIVKIGQMVIFVLHWCQVEALTSILINCRAVNRPKNFISSLRLQSSDETEEGFLGQRWN